MKHVFFVNSSITYLCAVGVILKCDIPHEQVHIVETRNLNIETDFARSHFPFGDGSPFRPGINFWKKRKLLRELDVFMDPVGGGEYMLYMPKTSQHYFPLLLSSKGCRGFCILEEGMAVYREKYPINGEGFGFKNLSQSALLMRSLKQLVLSGIGSLCYSRRYGARKPFYASGGQTAFCFSDRAFPEMQNRQVVSLTAALDFVSQDAKFDIPGNGNVVVAGLMKLNKNGSFPPIVHCLKDHLETLKNRGVQVIHLKPHPHQSKIDSNYKAILDFILPDGMKISIIPSETILELLAYRFPDAKFHIEDSSFGMYAHMMGRSVERYAEFSPDDMMYELFPEIPYAA